MAASGSSPILAYVVVYVKDVAKSVAFYSKAFGYQVRRLDESKRWGELESGHTTVAFTPKHQHETDDVTGEVRSPGSRKERDPVEVCFAYKDNGAIGVSEPEDKEWGQKVGYVRDLDGIVVRLGSFVSEPGKPHDS
ncbi:hypothetical protein DCAR_0415117 [Daucus carota subsp. sativus]|uniref:VOC domain-containing protein n=1 Tax=Daucus carota subsp. sativus TaxID=79200 RepID=A0AAF1AUU7_DAUCS|nr:hypothetical protein DCAR_0415117 [Daucus carota subsp. sativus]